MGRESPGNVRGVWSGAAPRLRAPDSVASGEGRGQGTGTGQRAGGIPWLGTTCCSGFHLEVVVSPWGRLDSGGRRFPWSWLGRGCCWGLTAECG